MMKMFYILGTVALGVQAYMLLRSMRRAVDNPRIDDAFKSIATTVDDIKQKMDALEEPVQHAIHGADEALAEAKVTMQKVLTVAENFNGVIETIELKPVRRGVKKLLTLPFKCCRAPKVKA